MKNEARRSGLRVTVVLLSAVAVGGPLAGEERVFVEPSQGGFRVDACESWGQGCGQRPVSLMITGRGRSSTGFLVGVDRIRLRPSQN